MFAQTDLLDTEDWIQLGFHNFPVNTDCTKTNSEIKERRVNVGRDKRKMADNILTIQNVHVENDDDIDCTNCKPHDESTPDDVHDSRTIEITQGSAEENNAISLSGHTTQGLTPMLGLQEHSNSRNQSCKIEIEDDERAPWKPSYSEIFIVSEYHTSGRHVRLDMDSLDNSVIENTHALKGNIKQELESPPCYRSLIEHILNDSPPDYEAVTGVHVKVEEILKEEAKMSNTTSRNRRNENLRTCDDFQLSKKTAFLIIVTLLLAVIGVTIVTKFS